MIFVTVGTHEQSFDRLIKKIDQLVEEKIINEEVIIQKGYSTYTPKYCKHYKLIGYEEMQKNIENARIIITHGGPASFMAPLAINKIPIVVPRQKKYDEHVNDHQKDFVEQVAKRFNNIIPIYNIEELKDNIINYEKIIKNMEGNGKSNNIKFCEGLDKELAKLFE